MAMRMPAMRAMGGGSRGYPRMGGAVRGVADPVDYSQLDQPDQATQDAQPTGGVMGAMRQPAPAAASPSLFNFGGGGSDFGDKLGKLGAIMMMLDPMSAHAGMAMMQLNQQGAANRRETARQNDTAQWLQGQGVKPSEAAFMAANPSALNAWNTKRLAGENPKWEFKELPTADGKGTQMFMVDMNKPENMQPIGGVKMKDPKAPIVVGGNAYDPDTHELVIKGGEDKAPTVRRGIAADGTEQDEQWNPQTNQWDPIGGKKAPAGGITITNPDGTTTTIGGPAGGGKMDKNQVDMTRYMTRMKEAEAGINQFTPDLTSFTGPALEAGADAALPKGVAGVVKQAVRPEGYNSGVNSGHSWLAGVLRLDSGGAITDDEWNSYGRMYIPQSGDSQDEINRKYNRRQAVMAGMDASMSESQRKSYLKAIGSLDIKTPPPPAGGDQTGQQAAAGGDQQAAAPPATADASAAAPAAVAPAAAPPAQAPGQPQQPPVVKPADVAHLPKVTSDAQWSALPAGAHYVAPDGSVKIKGAK